MLSIINKLTNIFRAKKETETEEYLHGFHDCLELLKIGYEKSGQENLVWQNKKLKKALFSILDFEQTFNHRFNGKINALAMKYNDEYEMLVRLTDLLMTHRRDTANTGILDANMRSFMLWQIIHRLIDHNFNLHYSQIQKIKSIVESAQTEEKKIQELAVYLTDEPIDEGIPDRAAYEKEIEQDKLTAELFQSIIFLILTREINDLQRKQLVNRFEHAGNDVQKLHQLIVFLNDLPPVRRPVKRRLNPDARIELTRIVSDYLPPDKIKLLVYFMEEFSGMQVA